MSLATAFKKMHPLQRRQIANILGWIAALLVFSHFYADTSRWEILLCVMVGCLLWLFAVYLVGIGGRKFKEKGAFLRRINNEQRAYIADSGNWFGAFWLFIALNLEWAWWQILLVLLFFVIDAVFCIALVGIKD